MKRLGIIFCSLLLLAGIVAGMSGRRGGGGGGFGGGFGGGEYWRPEYDTTRTAREITSHSTETPTWTNAPGFEKDVFTFARIRRDHIGNGYGTRSSRAGFWWTDFPDSDLDLSWRLSQMTSMKVDPDGRVLNLTDPDLNQYPWIYMVEPGTLVLKDEEVAPLRKYLLNGGVLMADDFWGEVQWNTFYHEIKRALPEREFVDLPLSHPIFHCVFDIKVPSLNKLQVPNFATGEQSQYDGVTWEYHDGEACREMHVRAMLDDKGHILVIAVHNSDTGDGWEREGEFVYYFHEFSEKRAYPLGINIVFYLMTH